MTAGAVGEETFKHRFSITPQGRRKKPKNVKWAGAELTAKGIESPDSADALIATIVLGTESQIDWKEAVIVRKEIKHQMQLDYLRAGRGRPHLAWGR